MIKKVIDVDYLTREVVKKEILIGLLELILSIDEDENMSKLEIIYQIVELGNKLRLNEDAWPLSSSKFLIKNQETPCDLKIAKDCLTYGITRNEISKGLLELIVQIAEDEQMSKEDIIDEVVELIERSLLNKEINLSFLFTESGESGINNFS